jgi:hypothetical protein
MARVQVRSLQDKRRISKTAQNRQDPRTTRPKKSLARATRARSLPSHGGLSRCGAGQRRRGGRWGGGSHGGASERGGRRRSAGRKRDVAAPDCRSRNPSPREAKGSACNPAAGGAAGQGAGEASSTEQGALGGCASGEQSLGGSSRPPVHHVHGQAGPPQLRRLVATRRACSCRPHGPHWPRRLGAVLCSFAPLAGRLSRAWLGSLLWGRLSQRAAHPDLDGGRQGSETVGIAKLWGASATIVCDRPGRVVFGRVVRSTECFHLCCGNRVSIRAPSPRARPRPGSGRLPRLRMCTSSFWSR